MSRTTHPDDSEFGPLITARGGGEVKWVGSILLLLVGALFVFLAPGLFKQSIKGFLIVGAIGVSALALGIWCLRLAMQQTEFYARGVRVTFRGKEVRSMAYSECKICAYVATRHYKFGLYVGTSVELTLKAEEKKSISWNGRHKEQPKGFAITYLGKQFTGEDEIDTVRAIVCAAVVDRWSEELLQGRSVRWSREIELRPDGVVSSQRKLKGQVVPYSDLAWKKLSMGMIPLVRRSDQKELAFFYPSQDNYLPGVEFIKLMSQEAEG